jgi:hypothetical protein
MNCKSCRKRKVIVSHKYFTTYDTYLGQIKCNRLRPTCEACQVFQCPCIYGAYRFYRAGQTCTESSLIDAVPKKRGPKTDVLEALLKRVDGLERRLKDEKKSHSPSNESGPSAHDDSSNGDTIQRPQLDTNISNTAEESAVYSPTPTRQADTLILMERRLTRAVYLPQQFFQMSSSIPTLCGSMERLIISSMRLQLDSGCR